jgi:hypothetical protein
MGIDFRSAALVKGLSIKPVMRRSRQRICDTGEQFFGGDWQPDEDTADGHQQLRSAHPNAFITPAYGYTTHPVKDAERDEEQKEPAGHRLNRPLAGTQPQAE